MIYQTVIILKSKIWMSSLSLLKSGGPIDFPIIKRLRIFLETRHVSDYMIRKGVERDDGG